MSDTPERPDETPDETTQPTTEPTTEPTPEPAPPPQRPATPGAAAASRARRIGGRPVPGRPAPTPPAGPTAEPAGTSPAAESAPAALSLSKGEPAPAEPETPAEPDAEADAEADAAAAPPVPAWLTWAPAGVLAVGALVMAVLLVAFSHGVWWGPKADATPSAAKATQQREQILAAAKSCVVAANDYDYRDLNGYQQRALACTTGKLTTDLGRTIQTQIKQLAPQLKAKQTTQISRGGIETVSPDGEQWTILLFGQLSVVNANYPKGRTDPFGAQVRMEKVHGKWVMADLQTVSSPVSGG